MSVETVTSRQNPRLRALRELGTDAAARRAAGLYLCEGDKLLADALQSGVTPATVVAATRKTLPALPPETDEIRVPSAVLDSLSALRAPQGVLFSCPLPVSAPLPQLGRHLLLDRVQDPGNVGSILRTAEALGLGSVWLTAGCADVFAPKVVQSAMGALFRLPVGLWAPEGLPVPLPLYVTALDEQAVPLTDFTPRDGVYALGNEGGGVSDALRAAAAGTLYLPMSGGAQSLGVAAAGAILCWHLRST